MTLRSLVAMAQFEGHSEAATLLQENLQMEERFGNDLEQVSKQLGQELVSGKPELVGHAVPGRMTGKSSR